MAYMIRIDDSVSEYSTIINIIGIHMDHVYCIAMVLVYTLSYLVRLL